jgi:hypothetical protein
VYPITIFGYAPDTPHEFIDAVAAVEFVWSRLIYASDDPGSLDDAGPIGPIQKEGAKAERENVGAITSPDKFSLPHPFVDRDRRSMDFSDQFVRLI